jgi:serpin B
MTFAGARGSTAEEMAKTLHFPSDEKRLHPALADLVDKIHSEQGNGYELAIANALWIQKGFDLQPSFLDTTKQHYDAGAREVDFVGDPETARNTANQWVAKQTNEKIRDLLQPGDLEPLTRLVLTNAIYFKGSWAARFPKGDTRVQFFFRSQKDEVRVPFMSQCATFPYWDGTSFSAIEFPYAGKHLSMMILLPRKIDGLPEFEKNLTIEKLKEWQGKLTEQQINVYLPRFKVSSRFHMKATLMAMGMSAAFDKERADFTGITGDDAANKLHISNVIHQAFVEVNEEGTEAAGSSGVIFEAKSGGGPAVHEPPTIYINHPFLFVIRDNRSASILFMGRVTDPSK